MKDVVSLAPVGRRVLVTGFGAFPGAATNPTEDLLGLLQSQRDRLAQVGIDLSLCLLPVVYDEVGARLDASITAGRPDAILHLGLASRRRHVSVETRALNRVGLRNPDAAGRRPAAPVLVPDGAPALAATYPATAIRAALRATGLDARLSSNAGDYVCNATLYHSLHSRKAASIGFIHVPQVRRAERPFPGARHPPPSLDELQEGVLAAIRVMADRRLSSA